MGVLDAMTAETEVRPRTGNPLRGELRPVTRPVTRPARPPRSGLRLLERVHTAAFALPTIVVDGAAVYAAAAATGVGMRLTAVSAAAVFLVFTASRVYGARCSLETLGVLWYAGRVVLPLSILALGLGIATTEVRPAVVFVAAIGVALVAVRSMTWLVLVTARRRRRGLRPTLVVGTGAMARTVVAKLADYTEAGLRPVGVLSPDGQRGRGEGIGTGALPADLPAIIRYGGIENVVLVPEGNHDVGISTCLDLCDGLDVDFALLPPLSELYLHPGLVAQVGGLPLLPLGRVARSDRPLPGKRAFDVLVASCVLVFAAPIMLATALAVWLGDRGPVFYAQQRVGRAGRVFHMLKFRSMVVDADKLVVDLRDRNVTDGLLFKMHDDPRVTRVGRVIRRLSIDELPQLLNVLRGEMSIVGPRPLPVDPDEFGALDGKRHSVPPGITGYWQVAGGTGLTYQEMVKLDLSYIQNWSLWLDLRILARTIPALLHRHGPC